MNKFIKEQLDMCNTISVEQISDTEMIITHDKNIDKLPQVNGYYLIELEDYIIHPNENFTLASNWNKGIVPKSKHIKCVITQIMGKMIKIDGSGYDLENDIDLSDTYLGLWLPLGGIKIIKNFI